MVNPNVTAKDQTQLVTWYTEHAIRFIEKNKTRPFFLYLAHNMPHVPLHVSDKFKGKSSQGLYGDVIMEIDWSVGEILRTLSKHHLEENTFIVFASDNGPWLSYGNHGGSAGPLREGKGTSWDGGGTRTPCIMRWTGKIPAGTVCDQPIMTIDLLPTIAGWIKAKLPAHTIDGLDLGPLILGSPNARNLHQAYLTYFEVNQLQAVWDGRWKLQLPHTYRTLGGRPGGRDGQPVKYEQRKIEKAELYDLNADIGEAVDVASQHADIVQRLEALAASAREELGDSLTNRIGKGVRPAPQVPLPGTEIR